ISDYRRRLDLYVIPDLGAIPVEALTRQQLVDWQRGLVKRGLAPRTIGEAHGLLSSVISTAVAAGWCEAKTVKGMRLPRSGENRARRPRFLTRTEFAALLAALPEGYRPLARFLAGTGCRWGEANALDVGDVDRRRDPWQVEISKALRRI